MCGRGVATLPGATPLVESFSPPLTSNFYKSSGRGGSCELLLLGQLIDGTECMQSSWLL